MGALHPPIDKHPSICSGLLSFHTITHNETEMTDDKYLTRQEIAVVDVRPAVRR